MTPSLTQFVIEYFDDRKYRFSRTVKGMVCGLFSIVANNFHGGNEKNHETPQPG
jgi:hypothetical protein